MPNATLFARCAAALLALIATPTLRAQQLDPAFHPPVVALPVAQGAPVVNKVLRQADGRYLIAGKFESVDGHVTSHLARLLATGYVDTTFAYRPATPVGSYGDLSTLAVQADGKVLLNRITTASQSTFVRLLPSGRPDTTFHPVLPVRPGMAGFSHQVVVQPDGKLLLFSATYDSLDHHALLRLLPSGQPDASFTPPVVLPPGINELLLEPSGRILYASGSFWSGSASSRIGRLLASGRVDASFTYTRLPDIHITKLALCPDGGYAVGGLFNWSNIVGRLLPTGAWDTSFPFSLHGDPAIVSLPLNLPIKVQAIAVQPDGQILAGGYMSSATGSSAPLARTQLHGGFDTSFNPSFIYDYRPYASYPYDNGALVYDLLVEPSGKLLVAGSFEQAGGVPHYGLARLLAAGPLATHQAKSATTVLAWPVPAHEQLNVQLPAAARQVELLDATGRTVLTQMPTITAFSLTTAALPTGLYVLRVRYADGSAATQRVVLE